MMTMPASVGLFIARKIHVAETEFARNPPRIAPRLLRAGANLRLDFAGQCAAAKFERRHNSEAANVFLIQNSSYAQVNDAHSVRKTFFAAEKVGAPARPAKN
jgi:hypothetical protein